MYSSLDYLPIKTYQQIAETDQIDLLLEKSDENKFVPIGVLQDTWNKLSQAYNEKYVKFDKSVNKIKTEISYLKGVFLTISLCCECLRFEYNEDLINIIIDKGYSFNQDEDYHDQLSKIERQLSGIEIKINRLNDLLPKTDDSESSEKNDIDDVMASYCSVLNVDFDFNTISVSKFFAFQKQVEKKIENLKKQLSKNNQNV